MPRAAARFVVERIRYTESALYGALGGRRLRLPAAYPVASFASFAEAQAECRRLERAARKSVNPFALGAPALFYQTSLDSGRLSDWLLDHGVKPPARPERGHTAWLAWWKAKNKGLSEAQRGAVWEALDNVRFYEASGWPAVAYAAVEVAWKVGVPSGDVLPADCEGGHVRRLFRSRAAAERAVAELDENLRQQERDFLREEGMNYAGYGVNRVGAPRGSRKRRSINTAPFAELVEVPMPEGEVGSAAYLLQRPAFEPEGGICTNGNGDPTEGVVPLALYATTEAAESARRSREQAARLLVSPFAFPPPHYSLFDITKLSFEQLKARVARLGLPLPVRPKGTPVRPELGVTEYWPELWLAWWEEHVDAMSDEQREGLWALLDRLKLFTVAGVKVEG
jgi:hypothetical protein